MHSKFTRVPDSPGTFKILSIAHQQNMCKKIVDDIEVAVHPIPKASVSLGEAREDVIREGDQVGYYATAHSHHLRIHVDAAHETRPRSPSTCLGPRHSRSHINEQSW